jgi:hypothetical protein
MKLVEILARELKAWPKADFVVQEYDGELYMASKVKPKNNRGGNPVWESQAGGDGEYFQPNLFLDKSEDRATAIVTCSDWEAERAKLKAPKANGGGWIRHRGGKCPVEAGTLVDVRYRSGKVNEHVKALVDSYMSGSMQTHNAVAWTHIGSANDIMAYRIHKPAEQPAPVSEPESELLYDPVAQGPLQWRDRIRELDTQRAGVESDYQRQISEITQERESLVQKLAGEGLALVGDKPGALLNWQRYAKDGMKINAIKEYRELTGAGLREAKETVEAYQDSLD